MVLFKILKNAQLNLFLLIIIFIYSQVLDDLITPAPIVITLFWGVLGGSTMWVIYKYQATKDPFDHRAKNLFCVRANLAIGVFSMVTFMVSIVGHMVTGII